MEGFVVLDDPVKCIPQLTNNRLCLPVAEYWLAREEWNVDGAVAQFRKQLITALKSST